MHFKLLYYSAPVSNIFFWLNNTCGRHHMERGEGERTKGYRKSCQENIVHQHMESLDLINTDPGVQCATQT